MSDTKGARRRAGRSASPRQETGLSAAVYEQVCALQADGLYLAAHDLARAALDEGADDARLRHRALDTLTRAGATSVALDLFNRWQLAGSADEEIGGLYPRLLKDFALERHDPDVADAAREAYTALWLRTGKAWLAANAAAMTLLSGRPKDARAAAAAIGTPPDKGDYWSAATAAELALLRGDPDTAAHWLAVAETRANGDLDRRVKIRRQLRWEANLLGVDPVLVEALRIPDVLHYCGQPPTGPADESAFAAHIAGLIETVGAGYGSLAAGGDIIVAEALLARGAQLHVFLPFPADAFEAVAVRPAGEAWVPRFRACPARARGRWTPTCASSRSGTARRRGRRAAPRSMSRRGRRRGWRPTSSPARGRAPSPAAWRRARRANLAPCCSATCRVSGHSTRRGWRRSTASRCAPSPPRWKASGRNTATPGAMQCNACSPTPTRPPARRWRCRWRSVPKRWRHPGCPPA